MASRRGSRRRSSGNGALHWFRGFLLLLGGAAAFFGALGLGAHWSLALLAASIGVVAAAIVTDTSLW